MSEEKLLVVDKLRTEFFQSKKSSVTAINEISFYINKGEIVGLVGESGCGKSVTSLSIMRLLNFTSGKVTKGEVLFEGTDLQKLSEKEMRQVRGGKMSMIFQEPMSSLNPAMRIDKQLIEQIRLHTDYSKEKALERAAEMLKLVGIPDPPRVLKNYPHQLSGGMSQRVMIAMAMSCNPQLLIADEPTTALDVTIQAQILELMKKIQKEEGMSILLITHDLGVVAEMCTRVIVMYAGEIVEEAPVDVLFYQPAHPYTKGLIACSEAWIRCKSTSEYSGKCSGSFILTRGMSFCAEMRVCDGAVPEGKTGSLSSRRGTEIQMLPCGKCRKGGEVDGGKRKDRLIKAGIQSIPGRQKPFRKTR